MYPKPPETVPEGVPPPSQGDFEGHPVASAPPPFPQAPSYAYYPGPVPPTGAFAGVQTAPARVPPLPGQIIVSWELSESDDVRCCGTRTLSAAGWATVITLILLCLPCLAWIPCMMADCHNDVLRPVYGYPGSPPGTQQQQGPPGSGAPYPPPVYADHV